MNADALGDIAGAIDNAARDLPPKTMITLGVENGGAWVELWETEPDGSAWTKEEIEPNDRSLAQQITAAVAVANGETDE